MHTSPVNTGKDRRGRKGWDDGGHEEQTKGDK